MYRRNKDEVEGLQAKRKQVCTQSDKKRSEGGMGSSTRSSGNTNASASRCGIQSSNQSHGLFSNRETQEGSHSQTTFCDFNR
jgi:hypothetical protein